jgi:FG-GAP-like repeat/FG-GAP repeat
MRPLALLLAGLCAVSASLSSLAGCVNSTTFTADPPTIPTPRLPMNDAYLGSIHAPGDSRLRPTFVWEPSTATAAGLHYELQYSTDRTFRSEVVTIETHETFYQPEESLPVSPVAPVGNRYFWRVCACVRKSCSDYTRPWYVNVGRVRKDYNGDGYADLAVGVPTSDVYNTNTGGVRMFFGGPGDRMEETSDGILTNRLVNSYAGSILEYAGDLNGDGFAELILSVPSTSQNSDSRVLVSFGGPGTFFSGVVATEILPKSSGDGLGAAVGGLGDVNGDGYGDMFVVSYVTSTSTTIEMFFGQPALALDSVADGILKINEVAIVAASSAGDFNGDGFSDLVIGDRNAGLFTGAARIYHGGEGTSFDTTVDGEVLGDEESRAFANEVAPAGDVNADGYADVLIARSSVGSMYEPGTVDLVLGTSGAFSSAPRMRLTAGHSEDEFGREMEGPGDVDGDGCDDLIIAADHSHLGEGRLYVFLGREGTTVDENPVLTLAGSSGGPQGYLGEAFTSGDYNGDGLIDLSLGFRADGSGKAWVYLSRGGARFDGQADTILQSPVAGESFGAGLASLDLSELRPSSQRFLSPIEMPGGRHRL